MTKSKWYILMRALFPKGTFRLMIPFCFLTYTASMVVQHYSEPGSRNGLITMAVFTIIYSVILGFKNKLLTFRSVKLRERFTNRRSAQQGKHDTDIAG